MPKADPSGAGEFTVLNLQGELFFAAAEVLQAELVRLLEGGARVIVLRVQEAYNMDATSAAALGTSPSKARKRGGRLLLCGVRAGDVRHLRTRRPASRVLAKTRFFRAERELLGSTRKAIRYAHTIARGERESAEPLQDHA